MGESRRVVQMDQVVGNAGMPRLAAEDRLEDGGALELIGVGLVVGRSRDVERDGIEDLRFVIVRIFLRQRFHRLEIGLDTLSMRNLVVVGVEDHQRIDVIALALGARVDRLSLLQRSEAERQIGRRRRSMRVVEQAQRDPPIGDRASRIGFEDILENLFGGLVPERVLVSHATIKPPLRRLVARGCEVNRAESLVIIVLAQCRRAERNPGSDGDGC